MTAQLAGEVRAFSAGLPWPDRVTALRAPDAWTVAIALPILKADADPEAVKTAVNQVQTLVQEYQSLGRPETWGLALDLDRQLLEALSPKSPQWPEMLDGPRRRFWTRTPGTSSSRTSRPAMANRTAKLSETQNDLIDALAKLVGNSAMQTTFAVERLTAHLQPWIEQDHWPVAEAAFAALQKALPGGGPLRHGTGHRAAFRQSRLAAATSASCGPA